jgi:hypothetical protein
VVRGGVTDLIKSVTHLVLAGWPLSPASTDFKLWIPCYCLLESVPVKQIHERLQSGASRPPPGPTGQWSLHIGSSCLVHSHGDTYFGRILIFLLISWNAKI